LSRVTVSCTEMNLVPNAGLLPAAALAQHVGPGDWSTSGSGWLGRARTAARRRSRWSRRCWSAVTASMTPPCRAPVLPGHLRRCVGLNLAWRRFETGEGLAAVERVEMAPPAVARLVV